MQKFSKSVEFWLSYGQNSPKLPNNCNYITFDQIIAKFDHNSTKTPPILKFFACIPHFKPRHSFLFNDFFLRFIVQKLPFWQFLKKGSMDFFTFYLTFSHFLSFFANFQNSYPNWFFFSGNFFSLIFSHFLSLSLSFSLCLANLFNSCPICFVFAAMWGDWR